MTERRCPTAGVLPNRQETLPFGDDILYWDRWASQGNGCLEVSLWCCQHPSGLSSASPGDAAPGVIHSLPSSATDCPGQNAAFGLGCKVRRGK